MTNYVLAYRGGSGMATTPEAKQQAMAEWGAWFGSLGSALVDGGNPFGESRIVHPDGSSTPGGDLNGYTILDATDLAAAADLAKGCPLLAGGGTVEVYETIPM